MNADERKTFDACVARVRRHREKCDYNEPEMESILWASERIKKLEEALRGVVQWADPCWTGGGYTGEHPAWGDVQEGRRLLE